MKIVVIDGQGGKMGAAIVKAVKESAPAASVYAMGTNSIATAAMLRAGADFGATGENPVIKNSADADIIMGPIGIVVADSILGEVTPKMAEAVGASKARKIVIPVNNCNVFVAGVQEKSLNSYIADALNQFSLLAQ